jgi:hypothetical protein
MQCELRCVGILVEQVHFGDGALLTGEKRFQQFLSLALQVTQVRAFG